MAQDKEHVMIDLETLGLKYNAAIISVAAVRFNITTAEEIDYFHQNITWESALKYGVADPNTVKWWSQQSDGAKAGLTTPAQRPIEDVMNDLMEYLGNDCIVWGNPELFDIGKLEYFYKGLEPWKWWNIRDMFTIKQIGKGIFNFEPKHIPFKGNKHNALDDARHQANYVSEIYMKIQQAKDESMSYQMSPPL